MYILARKGNTRLFEIAIFYFNQKKTTKQNRRGCLGWGWGGDGEDRTDCDAAESVFQIKKLNKRPQGQS